MISHPDDYDGVGSGDNLHNLIRIFCRKTTGLNICHINAQSLNNKIDEFRYIFEGSNIDVICISETWFHFNTPDNAYELNGYRLFRSDRQSHGGGVAIYVKLSIKCKSVCINGENDDNTLKMEYLFIEIFNYEKRLLLGTVYRPNRNVDIEPLITKLSVLTLGYSDVIVTGDFNSNILADERLMLNMNALGLNLINKNMPTHFTSTSSTLLDLFFTENLSRVLFYDQLSASVFSNHDLIFLSYDFKMSLEERNITFRDLKNIDFLSLENEVISIPWNLVFTMPTANEQVHFLHRNIQHLYDKYVSIRTKVLRASEKPWFSNEIKDLIHERNNTYKRWKRFRTPELKLIFKNCRRVVNYKIRAAKRRFYEDKFKSALSSKRKWMEIRNMGVLISDTKASNEVDVNQLNIDFSNIPIISTNIDQYNSINTMGRSNHGNNGFEFANVTIDEVRRSLFSIKSDSIGYDEVNPKFLKIILEYIITYILHLFNTILTTSEFPSMWKFAKIIPIPKADKSYRPIAILPYLSKVFERIVHEQISKHLHVNSLLTSRQSGFRSKHSCITALVDVAEELRTNLDQNMTSFLVLLDHSKAFDSVDHSILCHKLRNKFNFSLSAVKLLYSYLCDRSQAVYYGVNRSTSCLVKRGVPQGSILGPLLYSMYSNDLPSQITHCNIQMYADDVQLYISCYKNDLQNCIIKLNHDLDSVYKWATANGLYLNAGKSKAIIFGKIDCLPNMLPPLLIGNSSIQFVQSAKNLGVVFNNQLTWTDHINAVCGKTYSILRHLWMSQYFTPINIRLLLAKTYLIPNLLYGCELFANLDSVSKHKLNVTYNSIARYIFGIGRYSSVSCFSKQIYNMSVENLLKCRSLIFLHKIVYTKQPNYLYNRLQFSISNRGYRINTIRCRKLLSDRHFYISAIRLWNQLPPDIQLISNAMRFRSAIETHFSRF